MTGHPRKDHPMTEPTPEDAAPDDDRDVIDADRDVVDPDEFPPAQEA